MRATEIEHSGAHVLSKANGSFSKASTHESKQAGAVLLNGTGLLKKTRQESGLKELALPSATLKMMQDTSNATDADALEVVDKDHEHVFKILRNAKRYQHHLHPVDRVDASLFWRSVAVFDWFLLLVALALSMLVYRILLDCSSITSYHGACLSLWLGVAVVYNLLIYARQGKSDAVLWMNGYFLEWAFMVDNIFVYHVIIKAFSLDKRVTQRLIFVLVVVRIVAQSVLYMGCATELRSSDAVPYIVGPWLIYCGIQACVEDDSCEFDIMNSFVVRMVRSCLGQRLALDADDKDGTVIIVRNGTTCISKSGMALFCLLVADFLMEFDVTVTKIESIQSSYIGLSSSVIASFAVPELYFIARDLLQTCFALKYAIGFVLCFAGAQMVLHSVGTVPAMMNMLIMVGAVACSLAVSILYQLRRPPVGLTGGTEQTVDEGDRNVDPAN